jgi:hypothetical protein
MITLLSATGMFSRFSPTCRPYYQQMPTFSSTYTSPSPSGAALIYLKDSVSHTNYLVDTGAAISLVPFSSSFAATSPAIVNANGSAIPWNFVRKQLKFGKNSFVHSILQAKVSQPFLGLDFLSRHNISIDCVGFPSGIFSPNRDDF